MNETMDKDYIKDNQLTERYLKGSLSTEEQAAFEAVFLSAPQLLDELEAAEKLQQGLQDLAALEKAHAPEKQASWFMSMFHSPQFAMAASFLLVVSLGVSSVLLQKLGRGPGPDGVISALPTQITPLISTRSIPGSQSLNTLQLGDGVRNHVLMLDPGFSAYSHYRTTVYRLDPAGEPSRIWQVTKMMPGYEDMLALSLPGSILKPGNFEIRIEGWRDDWPVAHAWEPVDTLTFNCIE